MAEQEEPCGKPHTYFDHTTEASLRAGLAAIHASRILIDVALAKQLPDNPTIERHRLREANALLSQALQWTRQAINGPD